MASPVAFCKRTVATVYIPRGKTSDQYWDLLAAMGRPEAAAAQLRAERLRFLHGPIELGRRK